MKKYSICLLFAAVCAVCLAIGAVATVKSRGNAQALPGTEIATETVKENYIASKASEETSEEDSSAAEAANRESINQYYLVVEDGFLLVFTKNNPSDCLYTHVPITDFPEKEQARLREGIWFSSMMDVFSYLESFTS